MKIAFVPLGDLRASIRDYQELVIEMDYIPRIGEAVVLPGHNASSKVVNVIHYPWHDDNPPIYLMLEQ